jgi:7,8-dihydropterin-6-yl-methyl-4-(beta-D-ribofuranosyl)aminobenzene 5'-phosphate synthase
MFFVLKISEPVSMVIINDNQIYEQEHSPMKRISTILIPLALVSAVVILSTGCANQAGVEKAENVYNNYRPEKIQDLGSTKTLAILPLIDYYTAAPELKGEPGVSYLIKTDHSTILFDVGFNQEETDPSPLQHNMTLLNITMDDFDTIVISHNHPDHVGGFDNMKRETFSLGMEQVDLKGKRVFTPIPMTYPGITPVCSPEPTIIAPGVATIGTIPRQLFLAGWVEEQALAVNVEGKGIVLIVACGHQTVKKILERTGKLFDEPIFGIIGGLHYPVPDGRIRKFGLDVQPIVSTESPFRGVSEEDVTADIERVKAVHPAIVSLSPHDSSDEVLDRFRSEFGDTHKDLLVGELIIVGE